MKPEELLEQYIKGIREAVEESGIAIPNHLKNWEMPLYLVQKLKELNANVEAVEP